jgi:D-glycero-D-manno-heptose 1,7-bisphosphate phosphatase
MNTESAKKALFLDRDGTINVDKGYVFKPEDFEFQTGIFELVRKYSIEGFLIFVITNQSGIARGMYTEAEYRKLTQWMVKKFAEQNIRIEKVYHCPHLPEIDGPCECRKPKPGMIVQAMNEYGINPKLSVVIGDSERDLLAGKNAGIGKNLYIQDLISGGKF